MVVGKPLWSYGREAQRDAGVGGDGEGEGERVVETGVDEGLCFSLFFGGSRIVGAVRR